MVGLHVFIVMFLFVLLFLTKYNTNIIARRFSVAIVLLWVMLFAISYTNPYELFSVSDQVYALLLLFVTSFTIGITFSFNSKIKLKEKEFSWQAKHGLDVLVNNKVISYLSVFCLIVLIYAYFRQQAALQYATIAEYRVEGTQDYLFADKGWIAIIYNLFVKPFSSVIQVLFIYLLLFRRDKILLLIISALILILSTVINNSRGVAMTVLIYIVFIVFCLPFFSSKEKKRIKFGNVLLITLLAVLAFSFVSVLTAERMFGEAEFSMAGVSTGADILWQHVVKYYVGPFRSFEYALDMNYFDQLNGPTLGRSTFGFFEGFIGFWLNKIGIPYRTANNIIYAKLQNDWIYVGWNTNFAYTALFNYYMDFGYAGIAILPAIFGATIKKTCNSYLQNGNPALFLLLGYFFLAAWECYFGWILYYWPVAFYFIIIIVIYRSFRKKNQKIQTV